MDEREAAAGTPTAGGTVVGVFADPQGATGALGALRDGGVRPEQVSVVARDRQTTRQLAEESDMVADEAGKGAVVGTVLGGLAGWLIGFSALAIPGVGPIIGAGILGTTLAGAGIGAAAGGLIGALGSYGIPEEEARGYENSVQEGSVLLSVHPDDDRQAREVEAIFARHGGERVRSYGGTSDATTNQDAPPTGEVRLS